MSYTFNRGGFVQPAMSVELARLKRQLADLEARVVEKEKSSPTVDSYPDGAVIRFNKSFGRALDSKSYTYAAIKVDGKWHLTDNGGRSTEDMNNFLRNGVCKVERLISGAPLF